MKASGTSEKDRILWEVCPEINSRIEEEHIDASESVVVGRDAMEIITFETACIPQITGENM
jgi:hypothetical protein